MPEGAAAVARSATCQGRPAFRPNSPPFQACPDPTRTAPGPMPIHSSACPEGSSTRRPSLVSSSVAQRDIRGARAGSAAASRQLAEHGEHRAAERPCGDCPSACPGPARIPIALEQTTTKHNRKRFSNVLVFGNGLNLIRREVTEADEVCKRDHPLSPPPWSPARNPAIPVPDYSGSSISYLRHSCMTCARAACFRAA